MSVTNDAAGEEAGEDVGRVAGPHAAGRGGVVTPGNELRATDRMSLIVSLRRPSLLKDIKMRRGKKL